MAKRWQIQTLTAPTFVPLIPIPSVDTCSDVALRKARPTIFASYVYFSIVQPVVPSFTYWWNDSPVDYINRRVPTNVGSTFFWSTETPFAPPVVIFREPIKIVADILMNEMGIPNGSIMLTNQAWDIPNKPGLYVALSYQSGRPIANNNQYSVDPASGGLTEIQSVLMLYTIQIDFMSYDSSARLQKEDVYHALRSIYAEQQMEIYNVQLGRLPSQFMDVSSLEETAMLTRYTMTINVTALKTKTKTIDYYNQFPIPEVFEND